MSTIANHLASHTFKELFIEELGWDCSSIPSTTLPLHTRRRGWSGGESPRPITLKFIAQKRGVHVLSADVDRHEIVDQALLRKLQTKAFELAGEHILIAVCADDEAGAGHGWRKQVWQWMLMHPGAVNGTQTLTRHREHPFPSRDPPPGLLSRLSSLAIDIEEEESISSLDASRRVRIALDARAERHLFVKSPWYARESDRLARQMVEERAHVRQLLRDPCLSTAGPGSGDSVPRPALDEFLAFHDRLRLWSARWYCHYYPASYEDASQSAYIGLRRAAELYDPVRGTQFSTYAVPAVRKYLLRTQCREWSPIGYGRQVVHLALTLDRCIQRFIARFGKGLESRLLRRWAEQGQRGEARRRAYQRLSKLVDRSFAHDHAPRVDKWTCSGLDLDLIQDPEATPLECLADSETHDYVKALLGRLVERESQILELRLGLDGQPPKRLSDCAVLLGLSRERVRQIEREALLRIRQQVCDDFDGTRRTSDRTV